jgi:hypothetical protein
MKRLAVAKPMPLLPPVMKAVFPCNRMIYPVSLIMKPVYRIKWQAISLLP